MLHRNNGVEWTMKNGEDLHGFWPLRVSIFLFYVGWLRKKDEEDYDGHDDGTKTVMSAR